MKYLLRLLFLLLLTTVGFAEEAKKPSLVDSMKDWKTLKFILDTDGGDYKPPDQYILLQRIDEDHVVVSTCDRELPVAREILNAEQAQKLVDEAVALYEGTKNILSVNEQVEKLPKEKQDAIKKKFPMGFGSCHFRIEILNSKKFRSFTSCLDDVAIVAKFGDLFGEQFLLTNQKETAAKKEK